MQKSIILSLIVLFVVGACANRYAEFKNIHLETENSNLGEESEYYLSSLVQLKDLIDDLKAGIDSVFVEDLEIADESKKNEIYYIWNKFLTTNKMLFEIREVGDSIMSLKTDENSYGFLIFYTSHIMAYELGLHLIQKTVETQLYDILLNEYNNSYNLEKNLYDNLKWNILHLSDISQIESGYELYQFLKSKNSFSSSDTVVTKIDSIIEKNFEDFSEIVLKKGFGMLTKNGADIVAKNLKKAVFPIQKNFLESLSDISINRRAVSKKLLTQNQVEDITQELNPGDIVLQRREWYVTNFGIPGFWSHSALYLGEAKELIDFANDSLVTNFYRTSIDSSYTDFKSYMQQKHPLAWSEYTKDNFSFIEALSQGVVFTTSEKSLNDCDFVAAVRANLDRAVVVRAIEKAFSQYGKPYDFDFDFRKNNSLVCSGLIYSSFQKYPGFNALNFKLSKIAGGVVMTPNSIAEKFSSEHSQELEFVLFYDSNGESIFKSTENEFLKTSKRSNLFIILDR